MNTTQEQMRGIGVLGGQGVPRHHYVIEENSSFNGKIVDTYNGEAVSIIIYPEKIKIGCSSINIDAVKRIYKKWQELFEKENNAYKLQ